MKRVQQYVQSIPSEIYRLAVLENILCLLFIRKKDIKSNKTENEEGMYAVVDHYLEETLHMIQNELEIIEKSCDIKPFQNRFTKLKEYISEAIWRFDFVKWVQATDKEEHVR